MSVTLEGHPPRDPELLVVGVAHLDADTARRLGLGAFYGDCLILTGSHANIEAAARLADELVEVHAVATVAAIARVAA